MTSALGGVIMRNETVKPQMEEFVMKFVLPEFRSPLGFMRQAVSTTFAFVFCNSATYVDSPRRARSSGRSSDLAWNGPIKLLAIQCVVLDPSLTYDTET